MQTGHADVVDPPRGQAERLEHRGAFLRYRLVGRAGGDERDRFGAWCSRAPNAGVPDDSARRAGCELAFVGAGQQHGPVTMIEELPHDRRTLGRGLAGRVNRLG